MKIKLSAVAAIVATVLGVMAGGAPAHATPSTYTPTPGSSWASWTANSVKSYSVASGPAGSVTFKIPANTVLSGISLSLPLDIQTNLAYWGDGVSHVYAPTLTIRDSSNAPVGVTLSATMYGDFGLGLPGNYSYPVLTSTSPAGSYSTLITVATRTVQSQYSQATFIIQVANITGLAAGTYTVDANLLRDGLAISGQNFATGQNAQFNYTLSSTEDSISQTYPGDTGNVNTYNVQLATCINSSLLTVGDVLSYHRILDGADFTEGGPVTNAQWASWLQNSDPNYWSSVWQPTLTVTSAMAAKDFSVSKSMYPSITLADSGTHTVALSITNQNGIEVSKSCAPTATPTMTVTDGGPMTDATISVDVRRPTADALQVRAIDSVTQSVVYSQSYVYVGTSGSSVTTLPANLLTTGRAYNVSYRLGRGVQGGTVYAAWSTPVSYTMAAAQAPTLAATSGTVVATIPGVGQSGAYNNIVVAYVPSNNNTIVAGSQAYWNMSTSSTTATFSLGTDLSYSTDYKFGWCSGMQQWNIQTNTSYYICNSTVSPLSATYTTPSLPTPTVSVSGTNVMLSGGSGMGGGYVFYAASNTSTPLYVTSSSSVSFTVPPSGLAYATSYVVKYCPTVTWSMGNGTCTSSSLSPASAAFTVATPSIGYTLGSITNGNSVGSAVAGSTGITVPSGINASGVDGNGGRITAAYSGTNVTVKHATQSGSDATFGGSGQITFSAPATVQYIMSATWNGNRDKFAVVLQDVAGNYTAATGLFSGGAVTSYTFTAANLATACQAAYGTSTAGSLASFIPNPMGDLYINGNCSGVPITYSDASTGTVSPKVIFKVTGTNTVTVAGKLYTPSATVTNWYAASSTVTSTPDLSVNPSATGSATAVTFLFQTAARANGSASTTTITSGALKVGRLAADGTFTVTDLGMAIPFVSGSATKSLYLYELNDGTNVVGLLNDFSGQTPAYSVARIGASSVTLAALTVDAPGVFASGTSTLTGLSGVVPSASGDLWAMRRASGMSTTYAPVKISQTAGTGSTFEGVGFTMSTPTLDTWLVTGLNSSANPSVLYTTGLGLAANVYWRTVAVVGNQQSSDATATISVNDGSAHSVTNGGTLNVANSVTSVTVNVTPNEGHATVGAITGGTSLQVGNNTVSFVVTAQNGSTQSYSLTIVRATQAPSNVATAILTANGSTIGNGSTVNLANGTTSVTVGVTPTESHATYVVLGNTGLVTGNNTVTVTVTAQDGTTTQVYSFTAAVAASAVATATFTVNGTAVSDGGSISVSNATTSATVVVTRTESHATVGAISGASSLTVGDNTVTFTVTAQNGTTTRTYTFNIVRLPSDATACLVGTYSVHGGYSSVTQSWSCVDAPAGSYVSTAGASAATQCAPGYFSASVASTSCTPASVGHFVANAGSAAETACPANSHALSTGMSACDPDRVLSSNKNVKITIGGKAAAPGAVVNLVGIPAGRLNVNVSQDDIAARAYLSIPSNPVIGDNIVTVIVQAEDGSRTEQEIIVRISEPVVTPPVVTPPVVEPPVVTPPVVTPPVVTPPVVTPPVKSSDVTAVITVSGITVADGDHVNLPFGTASVPVVVTPTDSHATYAVTGATGLQTGTSVLTVTVTAEDGTVKAYSYQLVVAADMSPVNIGTANASVLQQVTAALDAGRVAFFNVTAKGTAAATKVLAQIRAFKTDLRAAGSTAKVSFSIKVTGASAVASVRVTP